MDGDGLAAAADVYSRVTDQILRALEVGPANPRSLWRATATPPVSVASGRRYRGVNAVALWAAAAERGYAAAQWATFREWKRRKTSVRRGERAVMVVLWRRLEPAAPAAPGPADGNEALQSLPMARAFAVFNIEQTEARRLETPQAPPQGDPEAAADAFFRALPISVVHGGACACYEPALDLIRLPPRAAFSSSEDYYAVRAHESVHASGARHRLGRDLQGRFGSKAYAMEELVAEFGAAFVCAELGLSSAPRPDHAAYIGSWLQVLREDKRAVFTAAAMAQRAADWLAGVRTTAPLSDADSA